MLHNRTEIFWEFANMLIRIVAYMVEIGKLFDNKLVEPQLKWGEIKSLGNFV